MDLLDEYHEHTMDDFIEGRLFGRSVWVKSDDKGHMVIYSPHMRLTANGRSTILRIEIPDMGTALEFAGVVIEKGHNVYEVDVLQFREANGSGRLA